MRTAVYEAHISSHENNHSVTVLLLHAKARSISAGLFVLFHLLYTGLHPGFHVTLYLNCMNAFNSMLVGLYLDRYLHFFHPKRDLVLFLQNLFYVDVVLIDVEA